MEFLCFKDYDCLDEKEMLEHIKSFIKELAEKDIFSNEEAAVINPYKIRTMLLSSLGKRMIEADKLNLLKKEKQFSAGLTFDMIYNSDSREAFDNNDKKTDDMSEDMIIVQGIIDAFFHEDNKIILMDYKTDFADEDKLIGMYKAQLDYYAYILEKITGLKVAEKIIYSFHLEKEIYLS